MCRFYQLSKHIDPVYMKSYSQLCQIYQFKHSRRWLYLTAWYFQTDNLCLMWSSFVLSDSCCPQYIDFQMRLACSHYWCRFLIHISFFFNMLFDLLRRNMFSPFNHFLQDYIHSQLLQLLLWLSLRQRHNAILRNDLIMSWKNSTFTIRQQKICFNFIPKHFW